MGHKDSIGRVRQCSAKIPGAQDVHQRPHDLLLRQRQGGNVARQIEINLKTAVTRFRSHEMREIGAFETARFGRWSV
jgi:hypothetical protein